MYRRRPAPRTECTKATARRCRGYVDAIPTQPGQIGAVFEIGGAVSGIELFDNEATFKKLVGKLARSYALDAIELPSDAAEPPDVGAVRSFVDAVRSAPQERATTVAWAKRCGYPRTRW
jgi:hypothetical protein